MSNTGENAELVTRLLDNRVRVHDLSGVGYEQCPLSKEAATALAAADARIAELEALTVEQDKSYGILVKQQHERAETAETLLEEARRALSPFIRLADNVFRDGKNATVADEVTLWCFNDTDITFGDLRRARATLDRIGK